MQYSTRDNVVFELGLFWSLLGRERTFVMTPKGADFCSLSDLQGLTLAEYRSLPTAPPALVGEEGLNRRAKNVTKLIEGACEKIAKKIVQQGPRELSTAPKAVFEIANPLADLMYAAFATGQPIVISNIGLDMELWWSNLNGHNDRFFPKT